MKRQYTMIIVILLLLLKQPLVAQSQLGSIIEDDDETARIGWAIALSADGSRMLAGAPNASEFHWLGGKVKVLDFINGEWTQIGQEIFGAHEADYFGTYIAMSADGSRFIVTTRNANNEEVPSTVVAYEWQNEQWDTIGQVINTGLPESYVYESAQMTADGSRIVTFTTYIEDEAAPDPQHAVQVYDFVDGLWMPVGPPILDLPGQDFQNFLALSGDGQTLVINGEAASNYRRFARYEFIDSTWTRIGADVSSSELGDLFAWSMSISYDGSRIAIGVPQANTAGSDSGNVLVYDWLDGTWQQAGNNIPGENIRDHTGYSVALSADGTRLAVGDRYYDEPAFNSGRMRVFQWIEENWVHVGEGINGEDRADFFGQKVAISANGEVVAMGGPQGGGTGTNHGQIKVFGDYPWLPISKMTEVQYIWRIYPNPVVDYLHIEGLHNANWVIYDLTGKLIHKGTLDTSSINLQGLPAGIYWLHCRLEQQRIISKIIKHGERL